MMTRAVIEWFWNGVKQTTGLKRKGQLIIELVLQYLFFFFFLGFYAFIKTQTGTHADDLQDDFHRVF